MSDIFDYIRNEAENQENFEELEHLVRSGAVKKISKGGKTIYMPNVTQGAQGAQINPTSMQMGFKGIEALIDISITRVSINIAATALEYGLFCQNSLEAQYSGIVNPAVGGTFVVDRSNPLQLDFVHTVGANTDRVRITSSQLPYISFLESQSSDMFRVNQVRYSISDATLTDQYSQPIFTGSRSLFGNTGRQPLPPASFRKPENLNNGIVDIGSPTQPLKFKVDKNVFWVSAIRPTAGFSVTKSFFINKIDKLDRAEL